MSASFIDDLSVHGENGPKQKNEDSEEEVKRERERKKMGKYLIREREREGKGRILSFFFVFNMFFFPSDTTTLGCLQRISGVCEHTH